MEDHSAKWLVETDWLHDHLGEPGIAIIDASWYFPTDPRNTRTDYLAQHIPGAVFFDIDEIADTSRPLPHMLPSPEKFSSSLRRMGIGDGMKVIVYDNAGIEISPRVWWTFRMMGHDDVAVLNGGLPKWKAENRPLEDGAPQRQERQFTARYNAAMVRDRDDIRSISESGGCQIVDGRSPGRFTATEPEPWPGVRNGRIPASLNVYHKLLLDPDNHTMKCADALRAAFREAGVDLTKPVVTTCGSGVTACVLALALAIMGHEKTSIYDGSWTEWGADDSLPIEP